MRPARALTALSRVRAWHPGRWSIMGALIALTAISLVLRTGALHLYHWADEGISVGIASHPLSSCRRCCARTAPLYYALLHVWMQAFGRDPQATHVLSRLFALTTVPTAYWGGTSLFGRRSGAICAVLAAGLPFLTA